MPTKKPLFTTSLPRGVVRRNVGPRIITPNREATAGVIGQRMQPVPKGGGNGGGGKSGGDKK